VTCLQYKLEGPVIQLTNGNELSDTLVPKARDHELGARTVRLVGPVKDRLIVPATPLNTLVLEDARRAKVVRLMIFCYLRPRWPPGHYACPDRAAIQGAKYIFAERPGLVCRRPLRFRVSPQVHRWHCLERKGRERVQVNCYLGS
jgi:hypothetical protein